MAKKPNIVLIMADQLAPQFLPCYRRPLIKALGFSTPLARRNDFEAQFDLTRWVNKGACCRLQFDDLWVAHAEAGHESNKSLARRT